VDVYVVWIGFKVIFYLFFKLTYSEFQVGQWRQLKFLDESHFVWKQLETRKVLGLQNKRHYITQNNLHQKSSSITILTSLDKFHPITIDYREESNSQEDFLCFLLRLIEDENIIEGDYLIMDNATVHDGSDIAPFLIQLQANIGFKIVFLPTYSPELNPCELVFAIVKQHLREWRGDINDRFLGW